MKPPTLELLPGTRLASTYFPPRCGPLQDGPHGPSHPGQISLACSRFSHLLRRNKTWDTSRFGSSKKVRPTQKIPHRLRKSCSDCWDRWRSLSAPSSASTRPKVSPEQRSAASTRGGRKRSPMSKSLKPTRGCPLVCQKRKWRDGSGLEGRHSIRIYHKAIFK